MPFGTTGRMPTEFDETTDAVLRTIQAAGTTDEEIIQDQEFLVDLMTTVGANTENVTLMDTIEAMDCAFIGLLIHRHMPYKDETTGEFWRPPQSGPADYEFTMNVVAGMLIGFGIPEQIVEYTANEGARRAVKHLRPPDSFSDQGTVLHVQVITLFVIGILVHRLMPRTSDNPIDQ